MSITEAPCDLLCYSFVLQYTSSRDVSSPKRYLSGRVNVYRVSRARGRVGRCGCMPGGGVGDPAGSAGGRLGVRDREIRFVPSFRLVQRHFEMVLKKIIVTLKHFRVARVYFLRIIYTLEHISDGSEN